MTFCRPNDSWPKEENDIDNKSYVGFSFSLFLYSFFVQLHQIALNILQQLRVTIPLEEAER